MSQPLVPAASVHAESPNGHTATPELKASCPGSLHASSYVALMGLLTFGHVHRHAEVCGCAGMGVVVHFHMHLHGYVSTPEHVHLSPQLRVMHMPGRTFMLTCICLPCVESPPYAGTLFHAHIIPCAHTLGHPRVNPCVCSWICISEPERKGARENPSRNLSSLQHHVALFSQGFLLALPNSALLQQPRPTPAL